MDKYILLDKIKKGNFTPEQLTVWVQSLPGSSATKKPSKNKVGDVYASSFSTSLCSSRKEK